MEYEIKPIEKELVVGIHIPSDANLSPVGVEKSLHDANKFLAKHYPSLSDAEYRCHSWLLDGQLKEMLRNNSNIICFQNRFEIIYEGEVGEDFVEWVFNTSLTAQGSS